MRDAHYVGRRGLRLRLTIEPRPISTWGITLASRLPKQEWDDLRTRVYREAGYQCVICEDGNSRLFCHEVWGFDNRRLIQKLIGLQCLCEMCSDVKHFGRSSQVHNKKYVEELIKHWCRVNGKSRRDFNLYLRQIFEINKKRVNKFYIVKVGRKILM